MAQDRTQQTEAERQARLAREAAALRENLRRRKAQSRLRAAPDAQTQASAPKTADADPGG